MAADSLATALSVFRDNDKRRGADKVYANQKADRSDRSDN